jgi:hypothetical protein
VCQGCSVKPKKTQGWNCCQSASTMYWIKGLNSYVNVIFFYIYFLISTNLFLPCNYGVLCVDWWEEKNDVIHFTIRL